MSAATRHARDVQIYNDRLRGMKFVQLSEKYNLTISRIMQIVRKFELKGSG